MNIIYKIVSVVTNSYYIVHITQLKNIEIEWPNTLIAFVSKTLGPSQQPVLVETVLRIIRFIHIYSVGINETPHLSWRAVEFILSVIS